MNTADSWETESGQWINWARRPGHESYWRRHRDQFLELLPSPGRRTIDIGCGEGRLTRHLKELGHRIVAVDASPSMVAAARELDPSVDVRIADASIIPQIVSGNTTAPSIMIGERAADFILHPNA
jgi:ubiquinone/menaquinone biosynthesis C-methylase UbiE